MRAVFFQSFLFVRYCHAVYHLYLNDKNFANVTEIHRRGGGGLGSLIRTAAPLSFCSILGYPIAVMLNGHLNGQNW